MFGPGTPVRFPEQDVGETLEITLGQRSTPALGGTSTGSLQKPGSENPGVSLSEAMTWTGMFNVPASTAVAVSGVLQPANFGGPKNSVNRKSDRPLPAYAVKRSTGHEAVSHEHPPATNQT